MDKTVKTILIVAAVVGGGFLAYAAYKKLAGPSAPAGSGSGNSSGINWGNLLNSGTNLLSNWGNGSNSNSGSTADTGTGGYGDYSTDDGSGDY